MGINNCNMFLRNVGTTIYYNQLQNKRIAIDILIYIFNFFHRYGRDPKITERKLISFLKNFRKLNIETICIFDGKNKPKEKAECMERRKRYTQFDDLYAFYCGDYMKLVNEYGLVDNEDKIIENIAEIYQKIKDKYSQKPIPEKDTYIQYVLYKEKKYTKLKEKFPDILISWYQKNLYEPPNIKTLSYNDIRIIKHKIYENGFSVYEADGEGENLCCSLLNDNKVDYVMSEDSDVFMYGAVRTLRSVKEHTCILIHIQDIYKSLEIDETSFKCLCIMMGTDYKTCGLKDYGFVKCLKELKTENGMNELVEKYNTYNDISYKHILSLFTLCSKYKPYVG
uniref:XPG-I domain-containing protein n=1 Tax=viral metagenome TaxID=1070528 RepID=A0A6C0JAU9_9ZZZZ